MSTPSLAGFVKRRPWLLKALQPVANWYANAAGYRQIGLRYVTTSQPTLSLPPIAAGEKERKGGAYTHRSDDLIPEESEVVQTALGRLNEKERYDRIFRIRRAIQCSIQHQLLPKNEWTKPDQDTLYLSPIIKAVEAENKERENLDNLTVYKKH